MDFLPDIVDGKLAEPEKAPQQYKPPKFYWKKKMFDPEENAAAFNNLGHELMTEDFSDSPALHK